MKVKKYKKWIVSVGIVGTIFFGWNMLMLLKNGFLCGSCDLTMRWHEIMCVLNGKNPIGTDFLPEIGEISSSAGYMPWAYFLGYFLVGSFNDIYHTAYYASLVFIFLAVLTSCILWRKCRQRVDKEVCLIIIISFLAQWSIASSWRSGNYGFQCCCLAIMAVCLKEKKFLSGILLALAMIKPQIGGLIFLTFALMKEYLIVMIAAILCAISWLAVSIVTKECPWILLTEMFQEGMAFEYPSKNNGIFTFLRNFNISNTVIMFLSMLLGILLCIWAVTKTRKNIGLTDTFYIFSPAALLAPIWFYYNPYDKGIMIFPIITVIVWLYYSEEHALGSNIKKLRLPIPKIGFAP